MGYKVRMEEDRPLGCMAGLCQLTLGLVLWEGGVERTGRLMGESQDT